MSNILNLLVEKQTALWRMKRQLEDLRQRPGRCLENDVAYGPCLLVSRQRGSGGGAIACLVGERLGWHLFNKGLIDEIRKLPQLQKQLLESVDEATRGKWEETFHHEPKPGDRGFDDYLRDLRRLVLTLGHQGDVIVVGRGAQYILPAACALRVRVVAPAAVRLRRMIDADKLSPAAAQAELEKSDRDREAFVQHGFQRDSGSPLEYDLVINTEHVTYEAAAGIVRQALHEKLGVALEKTAATVQQRAAEARWE
ncbi:MAG: cytidylate kinase-like family protein [Lentisphaeria bacterium]